MLTPESQQFAKLCGALYHTRAEEITCDEWLCRVAAYIEQIEAGQGGCQQLKALIARHTALCQECREELDVLLETLCPQHAAERDAKLRQVKP